MTFFYYIMIKKFFSFIFYLFIFSFSIFAKDSNFSITPFSSISCGKMNEHIYSSTNENVIISCLEWNLSPLYKLGCDLDFNVRNSFFSFSCDFSLPFPCGKMYDSDWNNTGKLKKTYSILEENEQFCFNSLVYFHYRFTIRKTLSFSPTIEASYSYFNIKSSNGYGWFGGRDYSSTGKDVSWDSPYAKYYSKVYGINYERNIFLVFTGIKTDWKIQNNFSIVADIYIAPYVYLKVIDTHLNAPGLSDIKQNQYQQGFFKYYKANLGCVYNAKKNLSLIFNINYLYGQKLKGPLYLNRYSDELEKTKQRSGSDTNILDFKFGVKFNL